MTPGERLLLLTLSLESALQAENWDEATQLFRSRAAAVAKTQRSRGSLTAEERDRIRSIDARILTMLVERKASVADALILQVSERKAHRTYRPSRRNAGFDASG